MGYVPPRFRKLQQAETRERQEPIIWRGDRMICNQDTAEGRRKYDHLRECLWRRQKGVCLICRIRMVLIASTFDHEHGRGFGGSNRDDRIYVRDANGRLKWQNAALCVDCNTKKGSKRGYPSTIPERDRYQSTHVD